MIPTSDPISRLADQLPTDAQVRILLANDEDREPHPLALRGCLARRLAERIPAPVARRQDDE